MYTDFFCVLGSSSFGLYSACCLGQQLERTLTRVTEALGLAEMGKEVTNDVEMIVCRCQQLVKLEGEKIVDKVSASCVPLQTSEPIE